MFASGIKGAAHLLALVFSELGRGREALSWATERYDLTYPKAQRTSLKEFLLKIKDGRGVFVRT